MVTQQPVGDGAPTPRIQRTSETRHQSAILPPWESFTSADRRRLVQTLLQAAQQHLVTSADRSAALGR
jgi:hypothetical protein